MHRLASLSLLFIATPALAAESAAGGVNTTLIAVLAVIVLACAAAVAVQRAWGLVATAVAGMGLSLYATSEKLSLAHGGASTCGTNDVINCQQVLTSSASSLFGIPVSVLGTSFYVAMAYLALRFARGQSKDAPALLAAGGVIAVGYDVYLGAQMVHIGAACIICIATYAINLLLLVGGTLAGRGLKWAESAMRSLPSDGGIAVVSGLVALIAGVMWYQSAAGGGGTNPTPAPPLDPVAAIAAAPGEYYEQVGGTIELDGTEPVYGVPTARYTIVEWADFQCPHCAKMFEELHELLPQHPEVKLLYKHYPISNKCNRFVDREGHGQACGAAAASECARQQGKFWQLAEKMFGNQEYLGTDDLKFMVEQVGMDQAAYATCMEKPETGLAVRADVDAGGKANINGTPSLFMKGAWGEDFVRLNALGKTPFDTLLAALNTGKPLPPPPPPTKEQ